MFPRWMFRQNTEDRKPSTVTILHYFEKNNILQLILVLLKRKHCLKEIGNLALYGKSNRNEYIYRVPQTFIFSKRKIQEYLKLTLLAY